MHPLQRNAQPVEERNEWGYLDYGRLDARIRSFNTDFSTFGEEPARYDVIYSVSVIEHMPAELRRAVIARIARLLRSPGRALFSLDLVPGSEALWNYNGGVEVDAAGHGTLDEVGRELAAAGLEVVQSDCLRGTPMSRTDVAYLVCRK